MSKATPYTIRGIDGAPLCTVDGFYDRSGSLVVHKALPDCAETGWQRSDGWTITHRWSDLAVGSRRTKAEALKLRRALSGIGSHAWNFTDPGTVDVAALRKLVDIAVCGESLHHRR